MFAVIFISVNYFCGSLEKSQKLEPDTSKFCLKRVTLGMCGCSVWSRCKFYSCSHVTMVKAGFTWGTDVNLH